MQKTLQDLHISHERNESKNIPIICWRRKMGCQPGHPQSYMLEYPCNIYLGCLGNPQAWALASLYSSHIGNSSFFDTSSTQNFNKNFVRSVSIIKQITTLRYCCKLIPISYYHYIYCIPTSPWFIPPDTTHRFMKISNQHIENGIFQKQDSL